VKNQSTLAMTLPQVTPPFYSLSFEVRTSLSEIGQYIRSVARELYFEAARQELEVTGAIYWMYEGMDGDPTTLFDLRIALPVSRPKRPVNSAKFKICLHEEFTHASILHQGPWELMGESYQKLISEIRQDGWAGNGGSREQYIHMDFDNPEANRTIIHLGVTRADQ
jgi:effector-binding domain-containing protein